MENENILDLAVAHAETEASHEAVATEGGAEEGLLASLGINGPLFAFQLINFAIVSVILWFLILKPLTKKMAEREKIIGESIDNAKRVETNLQKSEKDYQGKIDTAKIEANKILERANEEAEGMAEKLKVKATTEIEGLVEQAKRNIKKEKDDMIYGLKKETGELVVLALEKVLGDKMDNDKDKKVIEDTLKNLNK